MKRNKRIHRTLLINNRGVFDSLDICLVTIKIEEEGCLFHLGRNTIIIANMIMLAIAIAIAIAISRIGFFYLRRILD